MRRIDELKQEVCAANRRLGASGLVSLTWGNVSGFDPDSRLFAIKPSGVGYSLLTAEMMVVVDLGGHVVEGSLRPSSDTPTHAELYRAFPGIRGVVHTHSPEATAWAQAGREIPCFGTTHADVFNGPVPIARLLTAEEVDEDYETNTGKVIVERFGNLDPLSVPGVLVAGHGPFTWGKTPNAAVDASVSLEAIAHMARLSQAVNPNAMTLPAYILNKHHSRKHGPKAYYGQQERTQDDDFAFSGGDGRR